MVGQTRADDFGQVLSTANAVVQQSATEREARQAEVQSPHPDASERR